MAGLVVVGVTVDTDDRGRLHFWGEVLNLGQEPQRWVRVDIRLLGAQQELLAEQGDILGLEWTLPGEQNPFHIRFLTPPSQWHHYDIRLRGSLHDYRDPTVPQPHAGLVVERVHFREIERAGLHCSLVGLLRNQSLQPASRVKVAATLYGADGKVVGVLSPYLVPRGVFAPGSILPFELKFYALGGEVVNYTLQAQGRLAESG